MTASILRHIAALVLLGLAAPASADNIEEIFKGALGYTVQIKTAVPVPFEHDKKGSGRGRASWSTPGAAGS